MTNETIFETKAHFNKWLKELTESEKMIVIQMMDEARELGYDKGFVDGGEVVTINPPVKKSKSIVEVR